MVGESGSGKSTLGGLVAGLFAGHTGTMRLSIGGAPHAALSRAARSRPATLRRGIQMIFQDPAASLNPCHRVLDLVARAEALLARIGIGAELHRRLPGELSGGQQQRVAIARAFAAEPALIVCDEITSALDVTIQAQVLGLMRDLQRDQGVAYRFISHDPRWCLKWPTTSSSCTRAKFAPRPCCHGARRRRRQLHPRACRRVSATCRVRSLAHGAAAKPCRLAGLNVRPVPRGGTTARLI